LLSFIYTTCSDATGCPLATAVLRRVASRIAQEPGVVGKVRLITLSFDPDHDTPEVMRRYAAAVMPAADDHSDRWVFLTTASPGDLQPILQSYGQYVVREHDANGHDTGTISHLLKVFLIDRERRVRNIYGVSFLHPQILVNDIRTLLGEDAES
jgi:cytochrome c peroxidase